MLIDDIRAAPHLTLREPLLPQVFDHAVVFDVGTVSSYVDAHVHVLHPEDVPNVAPLARVMWLEWPSQRHGGVRVGALLWVFWDLADEAERTAYERAPGDEGWGALLHDHDMRWVVGLWVFAGTSAQCSQLEQPAILAVGGQGALLGGSHLSLEGEEPLGRDIRGSALIVALVSVCFAHCKGVAITAREQPRQQRRAAERAGRPALVTYKTLDIARITRVLREEGQVEKTGIKKALHICRGHFAHYTDERPLFGKYTGTFYVPMHVRGRLDAGLALKDYRVLTPEHDPS